MESTCVICGEHEETVDHLLMKCRPVTQVWYCSALRIDIARETSGSFREWFWEKIKKFPKEYVGLFAYTVWEIWKCRNKVIFDGKSFDPHETSGRAYSQWNELMEGTKDKHPKEKTIQQIVRWTKPQCGTQKLNCDVAVLGNERIGMGFVIRDHNGRVCLAGKQECFASGISTVLESIAMRFACQQAIQFRMQVQVIECDSKSLVDFLNQAGSPPTYCDVIIEDIKRMALQMGCIEFEFVQRNGNKVAHLAARGPDFICIRHQPTHLLAQLELDNRCS